MKASILLPTIAGLWTCVSSIAPAAPQGSGPDPAGYEIVERGSNYRVWQKPAPEFGGPNQNGLCTNQSYVELADGLNYLQNGQWIESREVIEPSPGGAIARQGQHKVIFAANLATAGAVDLTSPGGEHLRSHVLGLGYFEPGSGRSVLIGAIKAATGKIVGRNQVVYADAFSGFRADVRYTYTRSGFEQDIILREQPPGPESYGLDAATTRLRVLTEFLNPPAPERRPAPLHQGDESHLADETLVIGGMRFGAGKAFAEGPDHATVLGGGGSATDARVSKHWLEVDGRSVLIEEMPFDTIKAQLMQLPPASGPIARKVASVQGQLPPPPDSVRGGAGSPMEIAQTGGGQSGYVLDYLVTLSAYTNNHVFRGDTTYYVSGSVGLGGTTVIEGGTVIKYNNTYSASISISGTVRCLTDFYHPAVFTSKFDNSVGQSIASGTPTTYGGSAIYSYLPGMDQTLELSNVRFLYANVGFEVGSDQGGTAILRNVQFVNCGTAVRLGGYYYYPTVNVFNGLIHNSTTAFALWYGGSATGQNVTVDHVSALASAESGPEDFLTLKNSLLVDIVDPGSYQGSFNQDWSGFPGSFFFESVGAGSHYLLDDSFRDQGTTSGIDSQLLSDLRKMTTHAPVELTSPISSFTTLDIVYARDSDPPDVGYHYAPLDYLLNQVDLTDSLTLQNGVAVGLRGGYGLNLLANSSITSEGAPTNMNHVARYSAVQEQPLDLGDGSFFQSTNECAAPVQLRFTDIALGQGNFLYLMDFIGAKPYETLTMRDSRLTGAYVSTLLSDTYQYVPTTVSFTNNLIENSLVYLYQRYYYMNTYEILNVYNNLFRNTSFNLNYYYNYSDSSHNPPWNIHDNLFDGSPQSINGDNYDFYVSRSHNAFISGTPNALGGSNNKTNMTPDYVTGPLGRFYYPLSGTGNTLAGLYNVGSRTAASAGLFHFTTRADQGKEQCTTVDIGFHYLPLDVNKVPLDNDADSVPDYVEDANGNGQADAGESTWAPTVSIEAIDPGATEGSDDGTIRISRTMENPGVNMVVTFSVTGTATEGSDYSAFSHTVVIPAFTSFVDITIHPLQDMLQESPETVTLTLTGCGKYIIANPDNATVTITNGPPPTALVFVHAADPDAVEATTNSGSFAIWRDGGNLATPLTVNFSFGGTAIEGTDYDTVSPHQVIIPANVSVVPVIIRPKQDGITEGTETVILTITSGSYTIGNSSNATVNISDSSTADSSGTNFWLSFFSVPAEIRGGGLTPLRAMITSAFNTSGTVSVPGLVPPFTSNFTVTAGVITNIEITNLATSTNYDLVENKGIHVTSTLPVTVFGLQYFFQGSEAYLGYPTQMLGTNYLLMARPSHWSDLSNGKFRSQFTIVGTVTNTTVSIKPSLTANLEGHPDTNIITKTLHQGQTYQLQSLGPDDDVTGTIITSSNPISVFAGARGAFIPVDGTGAANPLLEQQLPVNAWGVWALTAPLAGRTNGDECRVLAQNDDTIITSNGIVVKRLQARQVFDFRLTSACEIRGSKAIQFAQFALSQDAGALDPNNPVGDPTEILVPNPTQYLNSFTVSSPSDSQFSKWFLSVFVEQSAVAATTVDSIPLASFPGVVFFPVGSAGYTIAQVEVQAGDHHVSGIRPVGLQVYGWGETEAFGYLGGLKSGF